MEKTNDLITPIKLTDAVKRYNISYTILLEWGKIGRIVVTKRAGVLYADDESIKADFALQESLKKHDEYRDRIITEKEEEVSNIVSVYDDYLFSMRSLEKIVKIFPVVINELSELIKDEKTKDIFINVALGKDLNKIARKYTLTYDRVCAIYVHAINIIEKRCGILKKYKNKIIEQANENRILDLKINNLKDHIKRLEKIKGISVEINEITAISERSIYLLSLNIRENFNLDQRICNCLQNTDIYTVEDLLRYVCNHDGNFNSLLEIDNFGMICLKRLKSVLLEYQIIDDNGYSYLFEYLM